MRVVIVDDDEWIRRGRRDGLAAFDDIEVVQTMRPDEALAEDDWSEVDVLLVDAFDPGQAWDRFPGVAVVEHVRRTRGPDDTLVVVLSGHILDPVLRLRMAEAGADFFYGHLELPDPASLADALRHPEQARRATPGEDRQLARYGLRPWSLPNAALRLAEAEGYQPLFTAAGTQKSTGAGRRQMIRARDQLAKAGRLDPSLADGERRPGDVRWPDVARFVNRALGRTQG